MNKKHKKGFTLIELLSIIIILGVVALIAVPIIMNLINKARREAFLQTAYGVFQASEFYFIDSNLFGTGIKDSEKINFPDKNNVLGIKGNMPDSGTVYIKESGNISLSLWNDSLKVCAIKNYDNSEIYLVDDILKEECGEGATVESNSISGMTWAGYITLTLYYPDNSTNREYRVGKTGEVREENWKKYEGPITIPIEEVENVYIKYQLNGKTIVVPPNGTLFVDIVPSSYEIAKNGEVSVKINYSEGTTVYYKTAGEWIEYKGIFKINEPTLIEARVSKEEDVYNSAGEKLYTRTITEYDSVYVRAMGTDIGTSGSIGAEGETSSNEKVIRSEITGEIIPSYYLKGPKININPAEKTNNVLVSLSTDHNARSIYIKIGNGPYNEYIEPVYIDKNTSIKAYYIRETDGMKSDESYKNIFNIVKSGVNKETGEVCLYPSIEFTSNKSLNHEYAESIKLSISTDGKNLEYSENGVEFKEYNKTIELNRNKTIYARSSNECGQTTEQINITNIKTVGNETILIPPTKKQSLNVDIMSKPESGRNEEVEVIINYDSKSTKKYYKIGTNGDLKKYEGPFTLKENSIVYAYALSDIGYGETNKKIDILNSGISSPIIKINPINSISTNSVEVSIEYDKNAERTVYRLGNGSLLTYNGPFIVSENTVVYAENSNSKGEKASNEFEITNIIGDIPKYVVEYGDYYLIKLNYPEIAIEESREYTFDGNDWKKYKNDGIMLVKKGVNINTDGQIKITDENGKEIIFGGDYYFIDTTSSETINNIKMRWDVRIPNNPVISVVPEEATKEANVSIVYDPYSKVKEYKLLKPDGSVTNWLNYNGEIKITEKNTIIYARSQSESEIYSEIVNREITNIDNKIPNIVLEADFETKTRVLKLKVQAIDDVTISKVMYDNGSREKSYFKTAGNEIINNSVINITENGIYTFYAEDGVGNSKIQTINITNIDKDAPAISINYEPTRVGITTNITIDYNDAVTKKYKIGTSSWENYDGTFTLTSDEVLKNNYKNDDNTVTICANGTDSAGNTEEKCEKIYNLDLDMPKSPIIDSNYGYPILTENGVKFDGLTTITYDERNDIDNYYSIDGENWIKYEGSFIAQNGTIYAKSVKKNTGLTVSTSKTLTMPSDALPVAVYDNNLSKGMVLDGAGPVNKVIMVDESMRGKGITVYYATWNGTCAAQFYDLDNNLISSQSFISGHTSGATKTVSVNIPADTVKMIVKPNASSGREIALYEIKPDTSPLFSNTAYYPLIKDTGVEQGYNMVTINYFSSSIKGYYKINDGEWLEYENKPVKVFLEDTIYAKGINKNNEESYVSSYKSALSDALPKSTHNNDVSTGMVLDGAGPVNKVIMVDKSMQGKNIMVYYATWNGTCAAQFYDENNNVVGSQSFISGHTSGATKTVSVNIPADTVKMIVQPNANKSRKIALYEIKPDTSPLFSNTAYYPLIKDTGVEQGYNMVTINYFSTSIKGYYKINDGEWLEYENKPVKVFLEDTIYAKGINKNNEESYVSSYKSALGGELPKSVIDNDVSTGMVLDGAGPVNKIIMADESIWGKSVTVYYATWNGVCYVYFYDENDKQLDSKKFISGHTSGATKTVLLDIPVDTKKIVIQPNASSGREIALYELKV